VCNSELSISVLLGRSENILREDSIVSRIPSVVAKQLGGQVNNTVDGRVRFGFESHFPFHLLEM